MEAVALEVLKIAAQAVLLKVVDEVQPNLPWLDKLFQMNKIEREVSDIRKTTGEVLNQMQTTRREEFIHKWDEAVLESDNVLVATNFPAIHRAAALVHALNEAGIDEMVLYDQENIKLVISDKAFCRSRSETLLSIANLARSNTVVEKVSVRGSCTGAEVIRQDEYLSRLQIVLLFVDTFHVQWPASMENISWSAEQTKKTRRERLQLLEEVNVSWLLEEEDRDLTKRIEMACESISYDELGNSLSCPRGQRTCTGKKGNVYVMGMQGTEKSRTFWLLTSESEEKIATASQESTRYITDRDVDANVTDVHITAWNTPGFKAGKDSTNFNTATLKDIVDKITEEYHLRAIIWQAKDIKKMCDTEMKMLAALKCFFADPTALSKSLLVVLRAKATECDGIAQYIDNWEQELQRCIGAGIGEGSYVCLDADLSKSGVWETNRRAVEKAKQKICDMPCAAIQNWVLMGTRMETGNEAKEAEQTMRVMESLQEWGQEKTKDLQEKTAGMHRVVRATYDEKEGYLKLRLRKKAPGTVLSHNFTSDWLRKKPAQDEERFNLRAMCDTTSEKLKDMEKRLQQLKQQQEQGSFSINETAIQDIVCRNELSYVVPTKEPMGTEVVYNVFAGAAEAKKAVVRVLEGFLGKKKTLKILKECANNANAENTRT